MVSAGVYRWPLDDAVAAAVETLRGTQTRVVETRMVAFGAEAYAALVAAVDG